MAPATTARRRRTEVIRFLIPLAVLFFVVAQIQMRLDYLSAASGFYAWVLARTTETKVLRPVVVTPKEPTEEDAFFEEVSRTLDTKARMFGKTFSELTETQQWSLSLHEMKLETRAKFESLARQGKLTLPMGAIEWSEETIGGHLGSLILGFRTAVADLLWLKVDDYWHQGRMEMMLPIMYTVVRLDPHFIDAWSIGAWHLAYNAPVIVNTMEEKRAFIDKAIVFLQDGIKRNPHHYQLYFELGYYIYDVKLRDYKNAAYYIEQACRYQHPKVVDRMLLHAYEKGGEFENALEGWMKYAAMMDKISNIDAYIKRIDPVRNPCSIVSPRFVLQLRAKIAQRDGREDEALRVWQELYDRFPGVNDTADQEITKIKARRVEAAGKYDDAIKLWQSLIDKIYPDVYDEALQNIARLNVLKMRGGAQPGKSQQKER